MNTCRCWRDHMYGITRSIGRSILVVRDARPTYLHGVVVVGMLQRLGGCRSPYPSWWCHRRARSYGCYGVSQSALTKVDAPPNPPERVSVHLLELVGQALLCSLETIRTWFKVWLFLSATDISIYEMYVQLTAVRNCWIRTIRKALSLSLSLTHTHTHTRLPR